MPVPARARAVRRWSRGSDYCCNCSGIGHAAHAHAACREQPRQGLLDREAAVRFVLHATLAHVDHGLR